MSNFNLTCSDIVQTECMTTSRWQLFLEPGAIAVQLMSELTGLNIVWDWIETFLFCLTGDFDFIRQILHHEGLLVLPEAKYVQHSIYSSLFRLLIHASKSGQPVYTVLNWYEHLKTCNILNMLSYHRISEDYSVVQEAEYRLNRLGFVGPH